MPPEKEMRKLAHAAAAMGTVTCLVWGHDAKAASPFEVYGAGLKVFGWASANEARATAGGALLAINDVAEVASSRSGRDALVSGASFAASLVPVGRGIEIGRYAFKWSTGIDPVKWASEKTVGAYLDSVERDRKALATFNNALRVAKQNELLATSTRPLVQAGLDWSNLGKRQAAAGVIAPKLQLSVRPSGNWSALEMRPVPSPGSTTLAPSAGKEVGTPRALDLQIKGIVQPVASAAVPKDAGTQSALASGMPRSVPTKGEVSAASNGSVQKGSAANSATGTNGGTKVRTVTVKSFSPVFERGPARSSPSASSGINKSSGSPYVADSVSPQGGVRTMPTLQPESDGALRLGAAAPGSGPQSFSLNGGGGSGIKLGAYATGGNTNLRIGDGEASEGIVAGGIHIDGKDFGISANTGQSPVIKQTRVVEPVVAPTERKSNQVARHYTMPYEQVGDMGSWDSGPTVRRKPSPHSPTQADAANEAFMAAMFGLVVQSAIAGATSRGGGGGGGGYGGNGCAGGSAGPMFNGQRSVKWWCLNGR